MARSSLRSLAVLLPMLPSVALAQTCFEEGMEYEGQLVIAPGYVQTPEECQMQCATQLYCAYFTWKAAPNNSATPKLIGPGGCLKYNDQATLVPAPGTPSETVSGPNACLSTPAPNATLAPVATVPPGADGTIATVAPTVAPTMPPVPTVPGAIFPTGLPTVGPINGTGFNGTGFNGTGIPGTMPSVEGESSGGGFPWWAILLIALVVCGIGAAVVFGICGGGSKSKKQIKKPKKSKREARQDDSEEQALIRAEAPPPIAEPVATQQPSVAPMPQYSGMAVPLATTSIPGAGSIGAIPQPQPAYGSQGPVFTSTGQMVYMQPQPAYGSQGASVIQMQQMPMQQVPMMQPQFR